VLAQPCHPARPFNLSYRRDEGNTDLDVVAESNGRPDIRQDRTKVKHERRTLRVEARGDERTVGGTRLVPAPRKEPRHAHDHGRDRGPTDVPSPSRTL